MRNSLLGFTAIASLTLAAVGTDQFARAEERETTKVYPYPHQLLCYGGSLYRTDGSEVIIQNGERPSYSSTESCTLSSSKFFFCWQGKPFDINGMAVPTPTAVGRLEFSSSETCGEAIR